MSGTDLTPRPAFDAPAPADPAQAAAERSEAGGPRHGDAPPIALNAFTDAQLLAAYLADRDAPCPHCRYNLRTLRGEQCPECGEALALRLQLVEPRLTGFLLGFVPLCMTLGFAGLLTLLGVIYEVQEHGRGGGPDATFYAYFVSLTLVALACSVAWLRHRRMIRRLDAGARAVLILVCWLLAAVGLVGGVIFIN